MKRMISVNLVVLFTLTCIMLFPQNIKNRTKTMTGVKYVDLELVDFWVTDTDLWVKIRVKNRNWNGENVKFFITGPAYRGGGSLSKQIFLKRYRYLDIKLLPISNFYMGRSCIIRIESPPKFPEKIKNNNSKQKILKHQVDFQVHHHKTTTKPCYTGAMFIRRYKCKKLTFEIKYRFTGSHQNIRGIRYRYKFIRVEGNQIKKRGNGNLQEIKSNEWSYKSITIEEHIFRNDWKGYIFEFELDTSRYEDPNIRNNKSVKKIVFDF